MASSQERLSYARVCGCTSLSLAYGFMLADQGLLVAPLEAERLFPGNASLGLGSMAVCCGLAQLVGPAAGKWSDSYRSRFGRRRPCMVMSLLGIVFLTGGLRLCSQLRWRISFMLIFLLQQVSWNMILTVQAGLVPDRVPVDQQGFAGGATAAFTLTGALGALLLVHLLGGLGLQSHYSITIGLAVLCTVAVCAAANERSSLTSFPPRAGDARGAGGFWKQLYASYQVDLRRYPEFAKLLFSKTMYCSSVIVKGFLLFFLQDTFRLGDHEQAQALVGQVAIAAETTAALSAGLAMLVLDCAKPKSTSDAAAKCTESTFGALCLPTAATEEGVELPAVLRRSECVPEEGCPVTSCATGRLLARRAAVAGAGWMGLLWFGPLLVGLGVLHNRRGGMEDAALTDLWMPYMVLGTALWGCGQGVYLAGDQALSYALLPDPEEASRFLGLASVCACLGAIAGGSLTGSLLWCFGARSGVDVDKDHGPGYEYPGYAAMFMLAASLSWAASVALSLIRIRANAEA
jgi:hypothetical protein